MKCPACFHLLSEVRVGPVAVDLCDGGCGGLWLDAFELRRLETEPEGETEYMLRAVRDPNVHVDPVRKRECPRCDKVKLKRRLFSRQIQVEIDECPGCAGLWLDPGELDQIRDHLAELRTRNQTRATQDGARMTVIRYLYQLRLEGQGINVQGQDR